LGCVLDATPAPAPTPAPTPSTAFDSRTFVDIGGNLVESISAYGKYWNFIGENLWSTGWLDQVPRYAAICSGKPDCKFNTRSFVNIGGNLVESITAYGRYWNFIGDNLWSTGSLDSVARYGMIRP
jgi:hypothetical protein